MKIKLIVSLFLFLVFFNIQYSIFNIQANNIDSLNVILETEKGVINKIYTRKSKMKKKQIANFWRNNKRLQKIRFGFKIWKL